MAVGPGKYDDLCTYVREQTQATGGVVVIVLNGNKGSGFSVQATMLEHLRLIETLEWITNEMRRGVDELHNTGTER